MGLGAAPDPLAALLAGAVGVGAEPDGKANPVILPVRGPGSKDAAAPEPLRAPEGVGGRVPFRALALFWNTGKVFVPLAGALIELIKG